MWSNRRQWITCGMIGLTVLLLWSPVQADGNDGQDSMGPSLSQPQYFNSSENTSEDFSSDTNSPATAAAKKTQVIPSQTAIPTEGVRWPHHRVYIYMDTSDRPIAQGFRRAVKQWNRTTAVHLVWTKKRKKADIFAQSRDMQSYNSDSSLGRTTAQLGATGISYNPDTHALIRANSALNGPVLDHSSLYYRSVVAQHELGHALGLAHAPEYENSVMVPTNVKTGITKTDRKAIRQLYGR